MSSNIQPDENGSGASARVIAENKVRIYRSSVFVIAALGAVLRTAAIFTSFDTEIGYFRSGSLLPATVTALWVAAAVWALTSLVLIPKEGLPKSPEMRTGPVYFSSVYAGFMLMADAGYRLYENYIKKEGGIAAEFGRLFGDHTLYGGSDRTERIAFVITIISIISSVLAGVSFFKRASGKAEHSNSQIVFGIFPVLRALCGLALIYFDMTVGMNSPNKLLIQLSLSCAILFFLCENRFYIHEDRSVPHCYFCTGLLSVLFCSAAGLSVVAGFYTGKIANGGLCVEAFLCLTIAFYAVTKINAFVRAVNPPVADDGTETAESENAAEDGMAVDDGKNTEAIPGTSDNKND